MKKVLIFSRLNGSGAPQRRVDNLLQLLSFSNFEAYVVRFEKAERNSIIRVNDRLTHISLGDIDSLNFFQKISMLNFSPKFARKWIDNVNPDLVIIYSTINFRTARYIKKYCKAKKIKLVFDVVEYRKLNSSFSLRRFFSYNLHNFVINNLIINKSDNVIVISKFLESFFTNKGLKNLFYYPITFDVTSMPHLEKKDYKDKITFLYAGSPGGKRDLINEILVAFSQLTTFEKSKIFLFVCGIEKTGLIREGVSKHTLDDINEFSKIMGRLNKQELYELFNNIDFTLLLKDETKIYSVAGFPTKMTESFSLGIPMLANYSGDISIYLKDSINGFVSPSHSAKDYVEVIRKAINSVELHQHESLSKNAYDTALNKLNTFSFILPFGNFIDSI